MSYIETADWSRVPERGHGVQFYYDDEQLLSLLVRYVGTALISGDVAILIATKAHRFATERRLAARGLKLAVPRSEGRYIALDAQATLQSLLTNGRVDEPKARTVLMALLRDAMAVPSATGGVARVLAFGEMVALLTQTSGPEEALRLEEVWNVLAAEYPFTLCCAYPMNGFSQRNAAPFVRICAQHSHVFHAVTHERRAEAADTAS